MRKIAIASIYDPLSSQSSGSVFVFTAGDGDTKYDIINKCAEEVANIISAEGSDLDYYCVGDVLAFVADNTDVQRTLAMRGVEFEEVIDGIEVIDNDMIIIDTDGSTNVL